MRVIRMNIANRTSNPNPNPSASPPTTSSTTQHGPNPDSAFRVSIVQGWATETGSNFGSRIHVSETKSARSRRCMLKERRGSARNSGFGDAESEGVEDGREGYEAWQEVLNNPSLLWTSKPGRLPNARSRSKKRKSSRRNSASSQASAASAGPKIRIIGDYKLEDVLERRYTPPIDLNSYGEYCRSVLCEELLNFVLIVRLFRHHYFAKPHSLHENITRRIFYVLRQEYLIAGSKKQINIPPKLRRDTINEITAWLSGQVRKPEPSVELCAAMLGKVEKYIVRNLNVDSFRRFKAHVTLKEQISIAKHQALWCCFRKETPTIFRFFTYPNPVDEMHARLSSLFIAFVFAFGLCETVHNQSPYAFSYITWVMISRAICGPRLDPHSFFILFVVDPIVRYFGLMRSLFVENSGRRFADLMCGTFAGLLVTLSILSNQAPIALIVLLVVGIGIIFSAFLHIAFNICIVCYLYSCLERRGIFKQSTVRIAVCNSRTLTIRGLMTKSKKSSRNEAVGVAPHYGDVKTSSPATTHEIKIQYAPATPCLGSNRQSDITPKSIRLHSLRSSGGQGENPTENPTGTPKAYLILPPLHPQAEAAHFNSNSSGLTGSTNAYSLTHGSDDSVVQAVQLANLTLQVDPSGRTRPRIDSGATTSSQMGSPSEAARSMNNNNSQVQG
ncbi:hypothetical protein AAMO2058_000688300 [Amorphochlora amoebiformis]